MYLFSSDEYKCGDVMNKKVLVVYFSWSGNTKLVAEKIHEITGGDVFMLETVVPYPNDYEELAYIWSWKETM